jgi:stearoyl-CoA desaturase (delta-9 desaturase)
MSSEQNKLRINWLNASYIGLSPLVALAGLIWWFKSGEANWNTAILTLVFVSLVEISITAGYHRLFSHISYKAHPVVQFFFLFFASGAFQNSALLWSLDHRVHHRYCDNNEKDPYSIGKGFWWAHMFWLFYKQDSQVRDLTSAPDLTSNKLVMWQHRNWLWVGMFSGFALPALIAWSWGDLFGGLLIGGFLRSVINHHATFLINSLTHMVGSQPYSDRHSARDNWFTAILTFGEGYHNFHHEFPSDYRNGVKHHQYDPSKWLIRGLSYFGLTSKLIRVGDHVIARKQAQMTAKREKEKQSKKEARMRLLKATTSYLGAASGSSLRRV